jgi:hypothetical protein
MLGSISARYRRGTGYLDHLTAVARQQLSLFFSVIYFHIWKYIIIAGPASCQTGLSEAWREPQSMMYDIENRKVRTGIQSMKARMAVRTRSRSR